MPSTSQQPIDFKRISQRKIIMLLAEYGLKKAGDFFKLKSNCFDPSEELTYHPHCKTFLIRNTIDQVWDHYKKIPPQEAWNGHTLSFGLLYSRKSDSLIYPGDAYPGLEEGQIIFINIKILYGLVNLAVAHHITEVNEEEKSIRICYIEKGTSEGSQWIRFRETSEGYTEIVHDTRYKSESRFRDRNLYPFMHERAITQFHDNVREKLLS